MGEGEESVDAIAAFGEPSALAKPIDEQAGRPIVRRRARWARAALWPAAIAAGFGIGLIVATAFWISEDRRVLTAIKAIVHVELRLRVERLERTRSQIEQRPIRSPLDEMYPRVAFITVLCRPECDALTDNGARLPGPPFVHLAIEPGEHRFLATSGAIVQPFGTTLEVDQTMTQHLDMRRRH